MPLSSKDRSILAHSVWLRSIDAEFARSVLDAAQRQTVRKGKLIYEMMDPAGGIYGVLDGMVGVRLDLGHAVVLTGHAFGPGDWFGEAAAITGMPRQVTVAALSDCDLVHLPLTQLQQICDTTPSGWRCLGIQSAISTGVAARVARNLLITDPRQRVRMVLQDLSGPGRTRRFLPITQTDLAEMCALSRSVISKILGTLEESGQVQRRYGRMNLLDGLFSANDS
ncbi:Crp/Fnr family transcriptional regulator [Aliiruegeria sabulilitoris]|uniref:Crp/Fnr family transcriptional regulator n=1 Tax=Aliiruegeria sabulilitoris TaxID=1510458 RepID=UPI00082E0A4C|nr:Crp/Fnr family transcriptional regulator [Aliiruegeria sabulilitoris]NDR56168.1 Crp/Fnr family transcriptional regulator [Pseudoruegeria sp. M32A2M]